MIDTLISLITNVELNSMLAVYLYWVPAIYCLVFYFVRTVMNYRKDKLQHEKYLSEPSRYYYSPSETVGGILLRVLASIFPVINLWCALFDLTPEVFSRVIKYFSNFLDIPLVPKKKFD